MSSALTKSNKLLTVYKLCRIRNIANYSQNKDYKVVSRKLSPIVKAESSDERDLNWELFVNKYRFYLPGLQAPANQIEHDPNELKKFPLSKIIDFQNKSKDKLHISYHTCPRSFYYDVSHTFPEREIFSRKELMIITLSYKHFDDVEMGQQYLSTALLAIYSRLKIAGFWTNFIHSNTGLPQYSAARRQMSSTPRFSMGLGVNIEENNGCVVVNNVPKSAAIYTNTDLENAKSILSE